MRQSDRRQPRHASSPSQGEGKMLAQDEFGVLWDRRTQDETYADGIGQTNFGPFVSKLRFFKVVSVEMQEKKPFEVREVSIDIALPTGSLLSWATTIMAQLETMLPLLEKAGADNVRTLRSFIEASKK
jgi:hypothetical protein